MSLPMARLLVVCALFQLGFGQENLGKVSSLSGNCYVTTTAEGGKIANVPATLKNFVVWDPTAPCPTGESYIHYAPGAKFQPMTAGAGILVHSYYAGNVANASAYVSVVGECAATPVSHPEFSWKVADGSRGGSCAVAPAPAPVPRGEHGDKYDSAELLQQKNGQKKLRKTVLKN